MPIYEQIRADRQLLELIGDIAIKPDIQLKKIKNAIKSYVPEGRVEPEDVLLLIDNTIFRSGKEGMILTEEELFAFSGVAGKCSLRLEELVSVSPQTRLALKVLKHLNIKEDSVGLVLNDRHFISLPGIRDRVQVGGEEVAAIAYLALFLHEALGCALVLGEEPDSGPAPWHDRGAPNWQPDDDED